MAGAPHVRLLLAALATVVVAAAPISSAPARVPSPQTLYRALLAAKIPPSELPAGLLPTRTKAMPLGHNPKKHHAVGELKIDFGSRARIVYVVFPTRADALGNHKAGVREMKASKAINRVRSPVRGFPKPSVICSGSLQGWGITQMAFIAGRAEIIAQTLRPNSKSGDVKKTRRLARFALRHLRAVEHGAS